MTYSRDLFQHLHDGAIVITPNNRLAAQLLQSYGEQVFALSKPRCMPYEAFLRHSLQATKHQYPQQAHPCLLSAQQQRYVWRQIIQDSNISITNGLLDSIHDAWSRCQAWQIHPDHPALQQTTETRRFQRWYARYLEKLEAINAITTEQIPAYLMQGNYSIPQAPTVWTCFDEFTPIQQRLQHSFEQKGSPQLYVDVLLKPMQAFCFPAQDQREEYQQMMAWIRERLDFGDKKIAIVVPELRTEAKTIQRLFEQHFSLDAYNISMGTPLIDHPIIGAALQWLNIGTEDISAHTIRCLLQSPFISGNHHDYLARAQLLQNSPLMKEPRLPWASLLKQLSQQSPPLYALLQQLPLYPKTQSPSAWAALFKERLTLMGFPGNHPINSKTYQYYSRFILLLDELMSLTCISTAMTSDEALSAIKDLAQSTIFQSRTPATRVTILGMLEASGCAFDSIWVSGLTDHCLPQKTRFSSFLPIDLQVSKGMPHSSASRELYRAQQGLHRLGYACQEIIYSYPKILKDAPQLPSALIQAYPRLNPKVLPLKHTPIALVPYTETYLHPPESLDQISGGTALLANQAKCPFQAFAAHRLKAQSAPEVSDGPDPAERGQTLHRIMETLWKTLGNQSTLQQMPKDNLESLINESINLALKRMQQTRPYSFSALIMDVEHARLAQLIRTCLDWEKQRAPFVIEALEKVYTLTLASIAFQIRIDRLDKTLSDDSNNKIVIDYKTSLPTTKPWHDDRPEAPQLLLYALVDTHIATLLFIQLKTGQMTLSGLSAHPANDAGVSTLKADEHWSNYQQRWEEQLNELAIELKQGHCEPNPKRASLCQLCSFDSLCRIKH